jgi:uncharacterized protein (TIGR03000 family)
MFSVVMAAALTASTSMPAWGKGCGGCYGGGHGFGLGKGCTSCYGNCYGAGWGSSAFGCGGGCGGGGCWGGGCWGGGCSGGGSCWGGSGYGCNGCSGCWGSAGHGSWGACHGGCHGSAYGCYGYGGSGWSSCYGGSGCYGGTVASTDHTYGAVASASAKPATLLVELPADAKLYVDGYLSKQASAKRTIVTPDLDGGSDYTYTLKAESVQDGQTVTKTKTVTFRAGGTVRVDFNEPAAGSVAQR